jgi:hypothetical protein
MRIRFWVHAAHSPNLAQQHSDTVATPHAWRRGRPTEPWSSLIVGPVPTSLASG